MIRKILAACFAGSIVAIGCVTEVSDDETVDQEEAGDSGEPVAEAAFASLYGFYLIKNVSNGKCLRAASIGANADVYFGFTCNSGDKNQNWYVAEVGKDQWGYGKNIIYLQDNLLRSWCISSKNSIQSKLVLEQCNSSDSWHLWTTDGPINYGTPYGDSYRLHWNGNPTLCADNGGISQKPYVYTCLTFSDPNRPNQQWYFIKNW